jgi:hypothetical protein
LELENNNRSSANEINSVYLSCACSIQYMRYAYKVFHAARSRVAVPITPALPRSSLEPVTSFHGAARAQARLPVKNHPLCCAKASGNSLRQTSQLARPPPVGGVGGRREFAAERYYADLTLEITLALRDSVKR